MKTLRKSAAKLKLRTAINLIARRPILRSPITGGAAGAGTGPQGLQSHEDRDGTLAGWEVRPAGSVSNRLRTCLFPVDLHAAKPAPRSWSPFSATLSS